jgi:hypothetical protein
MNTLHGKPTKIRKGHMNNEVIERGNLDEAKKEIIKL